MKKNLSIAFCSVVLALGAVACSGKGNEEKAKEFAADFARKASANQIDSLKVVYPGIENADSVALKYVEEGIVVKPTGENGDYEVILSPEVTIWVSGGEDGHITVTESKGLFAFTDTQKATAQKDNLWNDNLDDAKLASNVKEAYIKAREEEAEASAKFAESVPNVDNIYYDWGEYDNAASYLRSLGYQGSSKENGWDNFDGGYSGTFKLIQGSRECIVKYCCEEHFNKVEVTIKGDDEVLQDFYQHVKTKESHFYEGGTEVQKKGDTVTIKSYGA